MAWHAGAMDPLAPRRSTLGAALLALTLLAGGTLAGCGVPDGAAQAPSAAASTARNGDVVNPADVTFAEAMIPHHAQALVMTDMTRGRRLDPGVARVMEAISAAQAPEIQTMSGWLTSWGEPVPETARDHANAHARDTMSAMSGDMPGMMSAASLDQLDSLRGREFQLRLLTMMIEHHRGAVTMAETEIADGLYAPAVDLAHDVVTTQTAEIDRMGELRDALA